MAIRIVTSGSSYGTTKGGGDRRSHAPLAVRQLGRRTVDNTTSMPMSGRAGPARRPLSQIDAEAQRPPEIQPAQGALLNDRYVLAPGYGPPNPRGPAQSDRCEAGANRIGLNGCARGGTVAVSTTNPERAQCEVVEGGSGLLLWS